ncbi:MAG: biopolymer transporter ExbD [Rikenellaceae bacterium]|nr:biopolymer transporter ExbD [Rikenellaceae bacterium]MBR2333200.1 biopolymer transporter ExbD [Rikenellaceae bacterium]MBR2443245.1 biopolymer transporter ExbD [Rikenellaceae bacterium]
MPTDKRKIPEVNASSQADIAFMLLIFFLVATSMNTDTGIPRVLPAMPDENQKTEDMDVRERNLLLVFINTYDQIMVGGKPMDITQVKDKAKEFILNPANDEKLPESEDTEFDLPDGTKWVYPVSKGVISLQNDRGTSYSAYLQVQNELMRAFNEVRNEVARAKFQVDFAELPEDVRNIVQKAIPLKISESEPRNVGGKK